MSWFNILVILKCGTIRFGLWQILAILTLKEKYILKELYFSVPEGHYKAQVSNESVVWADNEDQSFASGLKLEGNEIRIPRNGLYFVYSQASYRLSCTDDAEKDGQVMHMSHSVFRYSAAYDSYKPLLSAIRSACKKTTEQDHPHWYGAIYLGAAFMLEAGDRLRTNMDTKLLPKVETAGGKTFFGAFSL